MCYNVTIFLIIPIFKCRYYLLISDVVAHYLSNILLAPARLTDIGLSVDLGLGCPPGPNFLGLGLKFTLFFIACCLVHQIKKLMIHFLCIGLVKENLITMIQEGEKNLMPTESIELERTKRLPND